MSAAAASQLNPGTATLEEFQRRGGISTQHHIVWITGEPCAPGFTPCVYPFLRRRISRRLRRLRNTLWRDPRRHHDIQVPPGKKRLFLGYYDASLDRVETVHDLGTVLTRLKGEKLELCLGKSDLPWNDELAALMPPNVKRVWANNLDCADPRARFLPMGRDFRARDHFATVVPQPPEKRDLLCYCNFSVDTHPVRQRLGAALRTGAPPWMCIENMGTFKNYALSRAEFYHRLAHSKFCLCPRGNAIDTFRFWDALYLGAIPIAVREARFQEHLHDLPVLWVGSPEEMAHLSEERLQRVHAEFLLRRWNFEKLAVSHWLAPEESP